MKHGMFIMRGTALGLLWAGTLLLGWQVTKLVSGSFLKTAAAAQSMQAQDVIQVDGSHVRRIYDPTYGVACYLVRWPAANAPDLACVKVGP